MLIYFPDESFYSIYFGNHYDSLLTFNEWYDARLDYYAALGLRPEPNNARIYRVIDAKLWMLTILKTGVKYDEIITSNHNS